MGSGRQGSTGRTGAEWPAVTGIPMVLSFRRQWPPSSEECVLWSQMAWVQVPALALTPCVAVGKLFNLCLSFLICKRGS